jgi:hypothetical protein
MSNRGMHLVGLGQSRCRHPVADDGIEAIKRQVAFSAWRDLVRRTTTTPPFFLHQEGANESIWRFAPAALRFQPCCKGGAAASTFFAGSKPLGVEATLPIEALCRLETATRPTEEVWRCSGCGQDYTTDASLHVYVRLQCSWGPIPGVPITTRVLHAAGDIKAMRCPPQQVCNTPAAASSASDTSPLLS